MRINTNLVSSGHLAFSPGDVIVLAANEGKQILDRILIELPDGIELIGAVFEVDVALVPLLIAPL